LILQAVAVLLQQAVKALLPLLLLVLVYTLGIGLLLSRTLKNVSKKMTMNKINFLQEKKIRLLFGLVAFIGGVTTILLYVHNRRSKKEQDEILALEKELRTLQIEKLNKDKQNGGF
jgi:NADH:ubiquinone oxidoreductase subunit 6 (subunit J)